MEKEFLISCHEVSKTTKNLTDAVSNIDTVKKSDIISALDALYNKISDRLQKVEENAAKTAATPIPMLPQESPDEKFFEDLCLKIYQRISNEENAVMYNETKNSQLTKTETDNLRNFDPAVYKKISVYVKSINHFLRVYADINKILEEAEK